MQVAYLILRQGVFPLLCYQNCWPTCFFYFGQNRKVFLNEYKQSHFSRSTNLRIDLEKFIREYSSSSTTEIKLLVEKFAKNNRVDISNTITRAEPIKKIGSW